MISPNDIKAKAERKYFSFLQSVVQAIPFSRIVIPGDKTYNKASIADFHYDILALANQSKEKKGFGFTIDYQTVKTKTIGMQSLPTIIYFDTEKDFLKFLGKEKEVDNFINDWQLIHSHFPELKDFCREIFRENLCSMYDKEKSKDKEWLKSGGNKKG
jgi:hypothetical protein